MNEKVVELLSDLAGGFSAMALLLPGWAPLPSL